MFEGAAMNLISIAGKLVLESKIKTVEKTQYLRGSIVVWSTSMEVKEFLLFLFLVLLLFSSYNDPQFIGMIEVYVMVCFFLIFEY